MLEVTGVGVNFGPVTALKDIDLQVRPGEIVAVSGEPGAGKTALVRCVAGDLSPSAGSITLDGVALSGGLRVAERRGIAVVWQDLALCETLDVAGNLLLGRETRRQMLSDTSLHARAATILEHLDVPIRDTTQLVATLPGSQRGLLALAVALVRDPRLLVLDEPGSALGLAETATLERLLERSRTEGAGVLLATRDIGLMFRLADRIVVLRHGRFVAQILPKDSHPDDVAVLLAGGTIDSSARRQLTRLHGLADSLAVADPSSGLTLIISALAAALGTDRDRIDVKSAEPLRSISERVIVDGRTWLVPLTGAGGAGAVITISRDNTDPPTRDELDLLGLYAGYASAAIERQDAEAAQREASALRRSRELQRQFLSRLSHELRTPLTAIRGYASSLLAPDIVWDDDSQQRFLETIAVESARLGRLVDDLLDFSAIDSGLMRMQFDWCELDLVLEAAIACLPDEWRQDVTVVSSNDMPVIWADHDRLEQVFVNLLNNAFRHNPPGTLVTIDARALPEGGVEVCVSDDGDGIRSEPSPFDSTDRVRSRTAGAGLGLSIARGIVLAHRGTIELLRVPKGTSFRILLPLEDPDAASEPPRPNASLEAGSGRAVTGA